VGSSSKDFEILEELGKGAHGTVFKAMSLRNKQVYVLKKVDFSLVKVSRKREALKEVELLKTLDHIHVVKYFSSFIEEDCLYIVMEWAQEGDLHKVNNFRIDSFGQLIKKQREKKERISEDQIWIWALQLILAGAYLNSRQIIHRDIKTLNVFLSGSLIKIGDLGVSKLQHEIKQAIRRSREGRVGTPLYLSPELVQNQSYDYKIDSWAVGCVIY